MKRFYLYLLSILVLISCSKEQDVITDNRVNNSPKFYAEIDNSLTRAYVNNDLKICWNENDKLSVFTSTENQMYKFDGNTGDSEGTFSAVETNNILNSSQLSVDANFAIFPYYQETTISTDGIVTFNLPQTQSYTINGFGNNSNPMITVTENSADTYLSFKNICGYLRLYLYGDSITVKSVRLQGNQNEKLSGKANVSISYSEAPFLDMSEEAFNSILLDCNNGVELGATEEDATEFWFVIPPVCFENGFTVIVEDVNGNRYSKSTDKKVEIKRNTISNMAISELDQLLEYQLFEKEADGIDGIITQNGAYALLKEIPNNDAIVLISGMYDEEEKDYILFDGNGFIKAMSIENNELISFLYTPDCVWVIDNNSNVIAEIPYDEFPSFENEPQTRATIITRNPIYQALSIRKVIKDFLKTPIKAATKAVLDNFISGKYGRYGETASNFIDAVFEITDILNLLGLLDKLQEIQFFGNASLITLPANVEDVVNASLPCEIKNLSDKTLYSYAKQHYGDVVNYSYTLDMNVYDNSSLISSIIDTQSKIISGDGIETFKYKADKLNHSYGYEPSLKVEITIEIDLEAACKAAIQDLPPGYEIPVGETRLDKKYCVIYGDKKSFISSRVESHIYDILNITDKSADVYCTFSQTPDGAICGIEYSSDKGDLQRKTTSNTMGEREVSLSSLQPNTKYTCRAYVQYMGEIYYSETSKSFTTDPKPLPDLSGIWIFEQEYYGEHSLSVELILESSSKNSATYAAKSGYYGMNQLSVTINSDGSGSVNCYNSYGYTGSFSGTFNDSYTVLSGERYFYGTNSWANPGWWVEESWSLHR